MESVCMASLDKRFLRCHCSTYCVADSSSVKVAIKPSGWDFVVGSEKSTMIAPSGNSSTPMIASFKSSLPSAAYFTLRASLPQSPLEHHVEILSGEYTTQIDEALLKSDARYAFTSSSREIIFS